MAIHGLKNIIALAAVSLLLIGAVAHAQPVPPSAPKLPTRPAPVSGKVALDPAAVALHPVTTTPALATSTARQVPPPANPNEPLLKPELEQAAATAHPASSAAQGKPHIDHTQGQKLTETRKGKKKVGKAPGHVHTEKTGAGHSKKKGSKGKAENVALAAAKAHAPKGQIGKGHHAGHRTKAGTSAPTVSEAHELKSHAHTKRTAPKKAHKVGTHHAKIVANAASQADHKPAVKSKKKAPSTHVPA